MSSRPFQIAGRRLENMNRSYRKFIAPIFLSVLITTAASVNAQEVFGNSMYKLDLTGATEAPKLGGMPRIGFPKEAMKNGVEGTLIGEMTLDETGNVKDIAIIQSLPFGYDEAFKNAFGTLSFTPAARLGEPVAVKLRVEFTVTMVFEEKDKNIDKPKITDQPEAVYPEEDRADKRKGEVTVGVLFNKDGTIRILSVGSTMPKSFDKAAEEAAKLIKFSPGTHKHSKSPVSVKMNVVYRFKP